MTGSEDEAAARARDIFEQLRSVDHSEDESDSAENVVPDAETGAPPDDADTIQPPTQGQAEGASDDEHPPAAAAEADKAAQVDSPEDNSGGWHEDEHVSRPPEGIGEPEPGEEPREPPVEGRAWGDPTREPERAAGSDFAGAGESDSVGDDGWGMPPQDAMPDAAPVATATSDTLVPGDAEPGLDVSEPPAPARPLPRVLAIANQKGGVGKTTTAVNLGAALAEIGYRVLVIDLDPQGNATTGLGINTRNLEHSVYDVILHDVPIEDCIEATSLRNLFVVPATIDLAGAEIELVPAFSREQRLRRALEGVADDFDFTVIDCPPSLGLLTVNGLTAATEVLVPIQCEYYALEGLGQLLRNVNLVQGNLNPRLELSTIILTMYDARTKLAEQVANEVREHFGDKVCRTMVPRTVRLSEAPSFGQPVILFDPTSRGAIAYRELAKEVSRGAPQRAR